MGLSTGAESTFAKCKRDSEEHITAIRKLAGEIFASDERIVVGVNGSYARREVTSGSDIDLFFLTTSHVDGAELDEIQNKLRGQLEERGFKLASVGGVFDKPLKATELTATIGGMKDSNELITRRMLLLLEGEWIHNQIGLEEVRKELLDQYLPIKREDTQICMFLLNDIIRYWRTICVDLEDKVLKGGKPRAVRQIKLRFSRMLLYFAGVLAVAETAGHSHDKKKEVLAELLSMATIDRTIHVLGKLSDAPMELYAYFLSSLDDPATREKLELSGDEGIRTEAYEKLRGRAHDFRIALRNAFRENYDDEHPIRISVLL